MKEDAKKIDDLGDKKHDKIDPKIYDWFVLEKNRKQNCKYEKINKTDSSKNPKRDCLFRETTDDEEIKDKKDDEKNSPLFCNPNKYTNKQDKSMLICEPNEIISKGRRNRKDATLIPKFNYEINRDLWEAGNADSNHLYKSLEILRNYKKRNLDLKLMEMFACISTKTKTQKKSIDCNKAVVLKRSKSKDYINDINERCYLELDFNVKNRHVAKCVKGPNKSDEAWECRQIMQHVLSWYVLSLKKFKDRIPEVIRDDFEILKKSYVEGRFEYFKNVALNFLKNFVVWHDENVDKKDSKYESVIISDIQDDDQEDQIEIIRNAEKEKGEIEKEDDGSEGDDSEEEFIPEGEFNYYEDKDFLHQLDPEEIKEMADDFKISLAKIKKAIDNSEHKEELRSTEIRALKNFYSLLPKNLQNMYIFTSDIAKKQLERDWQEIRKSDDPFENFATLVKEFRNVRSLIRKIGFNDIYKSFTKLKDLPEAVKEDTRRIRNSILLLLKKQLITMDDYTKVYIENFEFKHFEEVWKEFRDEYFHVEGFEAKPMDRQIRNKLYKYVFYLGLTRNTDFEEGLLYDASEIFQYSRFLTFFIFEYLKLTAFDCEVCFSNGGLQATDVGYENVFFNESDGVFTYSTVTHPDIKCNKDPEKRAMQYRYVSVPDTTKFVAVSSAGHTFNNNFHLPRIMEAHSHKKLNETERLMQPYECEISNKKAETYKDFDINFLKNEFNENLRQFEMISFIFFCNNHYIAVIRPPKIGAYDVSDWIVVDDDKKFNLVHDFKISKVDLEQHIPEERKVNDSDDTELLNILEKIIIKYYGGRHYKKSKRSTSTLIKNYDIVLSFYADTKDIVNKINRKNINKVYGGIKGIINRNNVCYLNAIMQCLMNLENWAICVDMQYIFNPIKVQERKKEEEKNKLMIQKNIKEIAEERRQKEMEAQKK